MRPLALVVLMLASTLLAAPAGPRAAQANALFTRAFLSRVADLGTDFTRVTIRLDGTRLRAPANANLELQWTGRGASPAYTTPLTTRTSLDAKQPITLVGWLPRSGEYSLRFTSGGGSSRSGGTLRGRESLRFDIIANAKGGWAMAEDCASVTPPSGVGMSGYNCPTKP